MYRIIVGSSNVTQSVLTTNREWNTKIASTDQGEYTRDIINEIDEPQNSHRALTSDQFIDEYTEKYTRNKTIQKQRELPKAGAENSAKTIPAVLPEPAFFHAKRTPPPLAAFRAKRSQWECWLFFI